MEGGYEYYVKCVRIRSFSAPYSPVFRLNMERYCSVFNPSAEKYRPEKLRIRTHFTQWNFTEYNFYSVKFIAPF